MKNWVEQNGVAIVRTEKGVGVMTNRRPDKDAKPYTVEVYHHGRLLKTERINPTGLPWKDSVKGVPPLECRVRVLDGPRVLAELDPPDDVLPHMVRCVGEQCHVTENWVSVPPALTLTDELGAVWTIGMTTAPTDKAPKGEFAFDVLRDGRPTGCVASRIERRNNKIRAFTKRGWVVWNGNQFL